MTPLLFELYDNTGALLVGEFLDPEELVKYADSHFGTEWPSYSHMRVIWDNAEGVVLYERIEGVHIREWLKSMTSDDVVNSDEGND